MASLYPHFPFEPTSKSPPDFATSQILKAHCICSITLLSSSLVLILSIVPLQQGPSEPSKLPPTSKLKSSLRTQRYHHFHFDTQSLDLVSRPHPRPRLGHPLSTSFRSRQPTSKVTSNFEAPPNFEPSFGDPPHTLNLLSHYTTPTLFTPYPTHIQYSRTISTFFEVPSILEADFEPRSRLRTTSTSSNFEASLRTQFELRTPASAHTILAPLSWYYVTPNASSQYVYCPRAATPARGSGSPSRGRARSRSC